LVPAVVAIDIGNSAAKWSVRQPNGSPTPHQRVSIKAHDWPHQIISDVQSGRSPQFVGRAVWRIATVSSPARLQLIAALQRRCSHENIRTITRRHVPMTPLVRYPDRLGIDRLLAGWMATRLVPGQRVVVVDAGSAITVDSVGPASEFHGGVILPGLSLQFESLGRGTDALPLLDPGEPAEDATSLTIPAPDTVSAIRSGILCGTAGAVDRLIQMSFTNDSVNRGLTSTPRVILTGGDGARLSPLLQSPHTVNNRLVLDALLDDALLDDVLPDD
jgi:type III pantothenate kinase